MTSLTPAQQAFVDRVDAEESVWDDTEPVPAEELPAKESLRRVVHVRLMPSQWEMLYGVAKELGIGPAALARLAILERVQPLYSTLSRRASGWARWHSQDPTRDEALYRQLLAGEAVADPPGAVYHRLRDQGYTLGWDGKTDRGWVIVGRDKGAAAS